VSLLVLDVVKVLVTIAIVAIGPALLWQRVTAPAARWAVRFLLAFFAVGVVVTTVRDLWYDLYGVR
jgi:hypothetical protein